MAKYAIGIDLGGTKILTGLINVETGAVVEVFKKKTKTEEGCENIILRVVESIQKILDRKDLKKTDITSIGIGAAGQVNRKEGILISAPNLDCYDVKFRKILEKEFGIPVYLGNDVEVATIGEMTYGAGKGCKDFVCVFIGTGIGSGIVHDGSVYHGSTGTAGEIGHIVLQPNGRACGCGANGCLEAYASRTAIAKRFSAMIKKGSKSILTPYYEDPDFKLRSKYIKEAVDEDDELIINCLTEAADYLALGLASIVNFYNPEKIILGGGLIEAVDFYFELIAKKVRTNCLPLPANSLEVVRTKLGDSSGIVGAAVMANGKVSKKN